MSVKDIIKSILSEKHYNGFRYEILKNLPDEYMLKRRFKERMGYPLNLDNPQTFNEKMQWLKLHDRNPLYTTMVDKYEVKKYVAEKIGEQYIIPSLGVWEHFDEIDFDKLPDKFVLKCTHDSGSVVLCRDKATFDKVAAKHKLERGIAKNYYYSGYEWPYKDVKPRIIAEKFMVDELRDELMDYKIHNFNGIPEFILVCSERFSRAGLAEDFFDVNWNHLSVKRPHHRNSDVIIEKPRKLEEMLLLSKKISRNIPFVRTDFYEIGDKIYFGEITFYPACGMEKFEPEVWDRKWGDLIKVI